MRKNYDFSKGKKNSHAKLLKRPATTKREDTVDDFEKLAEGSPPRAQRVRLYADFNAIDSHEGRAYVHLDRMGTLRDLCAARVRLTEGLSVVLFMDSDEDQDIEVDATVRWVRGAEGSDYWGAEYDPSAFRDVPITRNPGLREFFPCSQCGAGLERFIVSNGLGAATPCPECGQQVHAPIAPPQRGDSHSGE